MIYSFQELRSDTVYQRVYTCRPWLHKYPMSTSAAHSGSAGHWGSDHLYRQLCRGCYRSRYHLRVSGRLGLHNNRCINTQSLHLLMAVSRTTSQNTQLFLQLDIRDTSSSVSLDEHPSISITSIISTESGPLQSPLLSLDRSSRYSNLSRALSPELAGLCPRDPLLAP
jgi:hypothetical protein